MKDAERWMRCIKQECLSRLILFGEGSLRRALSEFLDHYRRNGITKAKATCCCFLRAIRTRDQLSRRFGAGSDWAVFLTITPMPREVFDHMGMQFGSQHVNSAVGVDREGRKHVLGLQTWAHGKRRRVHPDVPMSASPKRSNAKRCCDTNRRCGWHSAKFSDAMISYRKTVEQRQQDSPER